MYAIIHSGGKQYKVSPGDVLKLEKLPANEGEEVLFDKVLMVVDGEAVQIGKPFVEGGKVTGTVVSQGRGKKIRIIKFRRRKNSKRQAGHRQYLTEVEITAINDHKPEGVKKAKKVASSSSAEKAETAGKKAATKAKVSKAKKASEG